MRLIVRFNDYPEKAAACKPLLRAAVRATATAIEQTVKQTAPIRTGNLRRSYHMQMTGDLSAEVGSDPGIADYAVYVEYGTSRMGAQPHLRPAVDQEAPVFETRIRAALGGL